MYEICSTSECKSRHLVSEASHRNQNYNCTTSSVLYEIKSWKESPLNQKGEKNDCCHE